VSNLGKIVAVVELNRKEMYANKDSDREYLEY